MRITATECAGYFWLPEAPEHQLPGTLFVSPGGKVELEVLGLFGGHDSHIFEEIDVSRIIGIAEKWGAVTLDRCFETGRTSTLGGITKTKVFAHLLISGRMFGANEPLLFERLYFSTDGLHEWLCATGFKISHDFATPSSTYSYQRPNEISIELSPDLAGEFSFSCTLPGRPVGGKVEITENAVFSLVPTEPAPLDTLTQVAQQIVHFFCFAIDQTVSISDVRAQSPLEQLENRSEDDKRGPLVRLVFQSLPYSERLPRHIDNTMLFRFPQIRGQVDEVFSRWVSVHQVVQPALDLYFSARTGAYRYTEGRFLSLAQAIETLHRRTNNETALAEPEYADRVQRILSDCPDDVRDWLQAKLVYANELSLRSRIKRMIEPVAEYFGEGRQTKSFISNVVAWRNYLTHYGAENDKARASRKELFPLCMKMEALLQLHWLQMIGFSEPMIESVVTRSASLQNKLKGKVGYTG